MRYSIPVFSDFIVPEDLIVTSELQEKNPWKSKVEVVVEQKQREHFLLKLSFTTAAATFWYSQHEALQFSHEEQLRSQFIH